MGSRVHKGKQMTEQDKIKFLEAAIKKLFDKELTLNLDDNLLDLGIDSLDAVELQLHYEEENEVQLDDSRAVMTVRDLIAAM
jgi:acyl carrier protein